VQDIPGNDREVDVTFLWREIYDTRNVQIIWCPRASDCYMSRLPGTDVWYKTIRLSRGSRIVYLISPNPRAGDDWATSQLDPLNPRKFPDDPTYHFFAQSVLETPRAPDEQWAMRQPARRGHIEEKRIASALLGGERPIWIYTPPDYTPSLGPYPFVLLLDGAAYVSNRFLNAPATLDNLINDRRIRPVIVGFDSANRGNAICAPDREVQRLQPGGGLPCGADRESTYTQVVTQELIPLLRASYPIATNPTDVLIGGFSAGGRASAEAAFFHPDIFGNVLSFSGDFCDCFVILHGSGSEPNVDAQAFLAAPRKSIRFYLEAGIYDAMPGANLPAHELMFEESDLMGNRHFRDVLRAKGYDVTYREVGGGHDYLHWRAMLADGLLALLDVPAK
jgi:enterochelin esterase family protein